ncbi:hypothetical protein ACM39_10910 [Chryseobacterium sp. FH2]|nr:hypothetical protein ACM39_10910 [Chryseobacterium sp. FH2]
MKIPVFWKWWKVGKKVFKLTNPVNNKFQSPLPGFILNTSEIVFLFAEPVHESIRNFIFIAFCNCYGKYKQAVKLKMMSERIVK